MAHEWKDFISQEDIDNLKNDPLFEAYFAGFTKAREVFSFQSKRGIVSITNPIDHFLWWKDEKDRNPKTTPDS